MSAVVRGPDGLPLSIADLPKPGEFTRWTKLRKAQLMTAVQGGLLSMDDAHARYALSVEELIEWRNLFKAGGFRALQAGSLATYRYGEDA